MSIPFHIQYLAICESIQDTYKSLIQLLKSL